MSVSRFDIMRAMLLRGAGLNGKKVYLQSPREIAAARAHGHNIYTLPDTNIAYYIDTANLSDNEIDRLLPLKKLGFLAYIAGQLPLLKRLLMVVAVLLGAVAVFLIVLIAVVLLK